MEDESRKSFYQEAEEDAIDAEKDAMVLSLNPQKKKKNIPRDLKPINMPIAKMSGNYAAEVRKQLEEREQNKDRSDAIKNLNKEINGYLKFDTDDLLNSMNSAFEGKPK